MDTTLKQKLRQKLVIPMVLVAILLVAGTLGYYLLTGRQHSPFDCLYMVIITLSTVGYGEVIPLEHNAPARLFTMLLILMGMGILLYLVTQLTAFFVEGDLTEMLRRRKMQKTLESLRNHIIVCGAGSTAYHIARELLRTHWNLVVVAPDRERLDWLARETEPDRAPDSILPVIQGDPTDDRVLEDAGLERAHGVVAATEDDKENLFITVAARQSCSNQHLRIVARVADTRSQSKLMAAGADGVVAPNLIGGMRIASEMIRPSVVTFLDIMLRSKDENLRVEEVFIGTHGDYAGQELGKTDLRDRYDFLVLAVREPEGGAYIYKPKPDFALQQNMTLVVLGAAKQVQALRERIKKGP